MKLTTSLAICAGVLSGIVSSVVSARLTDSKRRSESLLAMPSDSASAARPHTSQESLGARTAANFARHKAAIDAHWRESLDPRWAEETKATFVQGLSTVKTSTQSEFDNVDCRSNSCVADIHFQNYDAELKNFLEFVTTGYEGRCKRELYGPVPDDRLAPYTVTLVLDCSAQRDAGATTRP